MEAGRARGADPRRPHAKITSPGAAVPKTAAPGDAELEESEVRRSARRNGYFFFAVFRTERLRAGAAFLARFLVDFFFIAIVGLLSLWSCATANQRRHVQSTTLIRLINLYRAPKFQRED